MVSLRALSRPQAEVNNVSVILRYLPLLVKIGLP